MKTIRSVMVRLLYKYFFSSPGPLLDRLSVLAKINFLPLAATSWTARKLIPRSRFYYLVSSLCFSIFLYDLRPSEVHARCEIKILVETVSLLYRPILPYVTGTWFITRLRNCFNSICGFLPPGLHNIIYILL